MIIESLSIEVTRRCNIRCGHCLRGSVQRKDMSEGHVHRLLTMEGMDGIDQLVLTGGEPTLVPDVIRMITGELRSHSICVDHFYIATNAVNVGDEFIEAVELLSYLMDEPDISAIEVSMDPYHRAEDTRHSALDNFHTMQDRLCGLIHVNQRDADRGWSDRYIGQGRARRNQISFDPVPHDPVHTCEEEVKGNLYLNCDGWVIDGGDWSYANQRHHRLFHVDQQWSLLDCIPGEEEQICA